MHMCNSKSRNNSFEVLPSHCADVQQVESVTVTNVASVTTQDAKPVVGGQKLKSGLIIASRRRKTTEREVTDSDFVNHIHIWHGA